MEEDRKAPVMDGFVEDKQHAPRYMAFRGARIALEVAEKFWEDNCTTFASSLAYTTLLAMAPLAAISLSVLSSFDFSREAILRFVFSRLLPNDELAAVIEKNIDTFAANAASVSIFGVITLAVLGVWVMSTVESSLNMIWKVEKSRPLFNQFVAYWSALTFSPVLIAASVIATARLHAIVTSNAWAEYSYVGGFILKLTPYVLTWVAFFLIYKLIPYTFVDMKAAWGGAIVAGTFFELAKLGFDLYLREFANYKAVYGALSIIPIFLVWLYVTWLIILLGSVIAYAIQYPKEVHPREKEKFKRSQYMNYYALLVLAEASRRFAAGTGPLEAEDAVRRFGITTGFYGDIIGKLKEAGVIETLEADGMKFLPAKPPGDISVAEVISALSGGALAAPPAERGAEEMTLLFQRVHEAIANGLGNLSMLALASSLDKRDVEPAD